MPSTYEANYGANRSPDEDARFKDAMAASEKVGVHKGMSKAESRALAYAREQVHGALDDLGPLRSERGMTNSEIRAIAAAAVKDMPAKMARVAEAGILKLAEGMKGGIRDDEAAREIAFEAATTAPDEWVEPGDDVNQPDASIQSIIDRIPR
jgi:hypothetical protein